MIIRHLPEAPNQDGPLAGTRDPVTLEDVAIQMEQVCDENSDIALCHVEADRLLIVALYKLADTEDKRKQVDEIVAHYNATDKVYE